MTATDTRDRYGRIVREVFQQYGISSPTPWEEIGERRQQPHMDAGEAVRDAVIADLAEQATEADRELVDALVIAAGPAGNSICVLTEPIWEARDPLLARLTARAGRAALREAPQAGEMIEDALTFSDETRAQLPRVTAAKLDRAYAEWVANVEIAKAGIQFEGGTPENALRWLLWRSIAAAMTVDEANGNAPRVDEVPE